MKGEKLETYIWRGIIVVGALILLPIVSYVIQFWGNPISQDTSDWASFGSYLSGIITPIISLASLIVLGYLSYQVSLYSSKENKNLMILQRRMDAYEDISRFSKSINHAIKVMKLQIDYIKLSQSVLSEYSKSIQLKRVKEVAKLALVFIDVYNTLYSFNTRHGYLFNYDFNSENFKNLLKESGELCEESSDFIAKFNAGKSDFFLNNSDLINRFEDLLIDFTNDIHKEVLPDLN